MHEPGEPARRPRVGPEHHTDLGGLAAARALVTATETHDLTAVGTRR
jgi:hypothetical protein